MRGLSLSHDGLRSGSKPVRVSDLGQLAGKPQSNATLAFGDSAVQLPTTDGVHTAGACARSARLRLRYVSILLRMTILTQSS